MIENYSNMLAEFGNNRETYTILVCIGFSLVVAAANIYLSLKPQKLENDKKYLKHMKLEKKLLGNNRLN